MNNICGIRSSVLRFVVLVAPMMLASGCTHPEKEVVLYCEVESETVAPILDAYSRSNQNIDLGRKFWGPNSAKFDVTSAQPDKDFARPDVVWTSNLLDILQLERSSKLQKHHWKRRDNPTNLPTSSVGAWVAVSAEPRVILVNTEKLNDKEEWPKQVTELSDPRWKDQCGISDPMRGSTATHLAILTGKSNSADWLKQALDNVKLFASNEQVAIAVGRGQIAWGVTDKNFAEQQKAKGLPVEIVVPDQGPDQAGAVSVPTVVAVLAGPTHPHNAFHLADYLTSKETGARISMANRRRSNATAESIKWMNVDYETISKNWSDVLPILESASSKLNGDQSSESN